MPRTRPSAIRTSIRSISKARTGEGLWDALRDVFLFWVEQGVRVFRVDNPHTKSLYFWEWVIAEVKRDVREAIFLSEAFTRPALMHRLAKAGFSQSYNYFPWRNTKWELTQYLTELTQGPGREYFRPSLWPNTPDILPEYLQFGGRPAFATRLTLAATLGASYGIYGPAFELHENQARDPAARNISTPRNTRSKPGTSTAATVFAISSRGSTASAGTTRRSAMTGACAFTPSTTSS